MKVIRNSNVLFENAVAQHYPFKHFDGYIEHNAIGNYVVEWRNSNYIIRRPMLVGGKFIIWQKVFRINTERPTDFELSSDVRFDGELKNLANRLMKSLL